MSFPDPTSARRTLSPFRALQAVAAVTARESLRQPITLLLVYAFTGAILLLPLLLNYTLGDGARIVRDSACSLVFLGALLLAIALATDAVARDFRRGTASVVLAKSVPRWAYLLGKAAGVALPVLTYALIAAAATLLAIRIAGDGLRADWATAAVALPSVPLALLMAALWNYLTRRPLAAVAIGLLLALLLLALLAAALRPDLDGLVFPHNLNLPALPAVLLLALPALMAVALATGLAALLRPAVGFVLTLLPFLLGMVSDPLLAARPGLLPRCLYAVLPNIQAFWLLDATGLLDGTGLPFPYLLLSLLYALAWSLTALLLASLLFQHREIQ
ncbi:MAG: hypothetical protein ILO10_04335 [Kiritimatiellae bacterium]|nr:hypothetical protein [Kiritimatiellia bacterium]